MWQKPFDSTLAKRHSAPKMTLVATVGLPRPLNIIKFGLTFELVMVICVITR